MMNLSMIPIKSTGAGLIAAFAASLCCMAPVLSFLAGAGGMAATFSWVAPFRPFLVALTIGILGLAWFQKLKPLKSHAECDCDPSFWQTKKFLSIVTFLAGLMITFPNYAHIFYPNSGNQNSITVNETDSTRQVVIHVKGMTCTSCEVHIEMALSRLDGIKNVKASHTSGTATVNFLPNVVKENQIIDAINQTGYKVVDDNSIQITIQDPGNISFYKVPLVCPAAPTIGCGSRSKPLLIDLEKSEKIQEAWLSREGTVIAVVWKKETDLQARRDIITQIFTIHNTNASELLMNDHTKNLQSFVQKDEWYRGAEVNKLSKEEAGIIADRLLTAIKGQTSLTDDQESKLRIKIVDSLYDLFINFKSMDDLADPETYKPVLSEIVEFGNDLLHQSSGNKDELGMLDINTLWAACSADAKNCDHDGCTTSCKLK